MSSINESTNETTMLKMIRKRSGDSCIPIYSFLSEPFPERRAYVMFATNILGLIFLGTIEVSRVSSRKKKNNDDDNNNNKIAVYFIFNQLLGYTKVLERI
jgi:hypothetical protein